MQPTLTSSFDTLSQFEACICKKYRFFSSSPCFSNRCRYPITWFLLENKISTDHWSLHHASTPHGEDNNTKRRRAFGGLCGPFVEKYFINSEQDPTGSYTYLHLWLIYKNYYQKLIRVMGFCYYTILHRLKLSESLKNRRNTKTREETNGRQGWVISDFQEDLYFVGCLWHSTVKIRGCTQNCKASQ